jgi:DNA-binding response OmpR family regulator
LEVDAKRHSVTLDGHLVHLTPNEFKLLYIMARHPGQTFTREQLMDDLYGAAPAGVDRSIDSHVKNLRRKLEPEPGSPRFIETVYGVGYRLMEQPET